MALARRADGAASVVNRMPSLDVADTRLLSSNAVASSDEIGALRTQ